MNMKKIYALIAVVLASCTLSFAQNQAPQKAEQDQQTEKTEQKVSSLNTTRMGSEHRVNVGGYIGHGTGYFAHYGALFLDINSRTSNLRTRIHVGDMQRWFNPSVAVEEQYLFPVVGGLYVYPTAGLYSEFHFTVDAAEKFIAAGLQGGLGLEYQLNDNLGIFGEAGGQLLIFSPNRFKVHFGITYAF